MTILTGGPAGAGDSELADLQRHAEMCAQLDAERTKVAQAEAELLTGRAEICDVTTARQRGGSIGGGRGGRPRRATRRPGRWKLAWTVTTMGREVSVVKSILLPGQESVYGGPGGEPGGERGGELGPLGGGEPRRGRGGKQPGDAELYQEQERARCARDVVYFVDTHCQTYDPREEPTTLRFQLFPRQSDFLRWLGEREQNQEDGVAEKCRDVGFTWLCCAYAVHGWLFREGFRVGFGSRKLALVDTLGDPKSIFEKMRFLIARLPSWMQPRDYSLGYCKLLNNDTGSTISGEGGDEIGRGDRTALYFLDEAAFLERSHRVEAALSQTSRCKIWVSTPNGQGNAFYRRRFSGRFPVFTFGWRDDPRKGDAWYAEQKRTLDPVTLAQEVEIDYAASMEGVCIPAAWVRAAVDLAARLALQGVELPRGPLMAALDIAAEGGNRNVLGFRRGVVVESPILSWSGVSGTYTAMKTKEECERRGVAQLNYDAGGGYGEAMAQVGREGVGFGLRGLNGGETPSLVCWPDGRLSRDKFVNARAEWWWQLRERFRKTWELVEEGVAHPVGELISIPNDAALIAEISLPLVETAETGKVRIESKAKMRSRGVASPDYADMLAYLFVEKVEFVFGFHIA